MKLSIDLRKASSIAIGLVLFYAFATRSVIGPLIFRGFISICYYAIMYALLVFCFVSSFCSVNGRGIYAPSGFFSLFLVSMVIAFGLFRGDSLGSFRYYGIAILCPFALLPQIKQSRRVPIAFVIIGVVLFVGCLINYLFPVVYTALIMKFFTQSSIESIEWQLSLGSYYPGFTSQVGYTSFFISTAMGALFCFRKEIFGKAFLPLTMVLFLGMLFTGKRGPIVYLLLALIAVFYFESKGNQRLLRPFQIIGIVIGAYFALAALNALGIQIGGIERIYNSINEFLFTGDIDDAGRDQLHEQAMLYFEQSPVFGIGWNNFMKMFTLRNTHCHNIYYQLLCETGIVGFSVFIFFFVTRIIGTIKKLNLSIYMEMKEAPWLKLSLFIQVFFLLYGFSGNPLYDIEETILYFFAVGISFLPQDKRTISFE